MASILSWLRNIILGRRRGVSPFAAGAGPMRLVVMRHGEKTGDKAERHLSPAGQKRAEALVDYIPRKFGRPDFLLAAGRNPHSDRPVDMLKPLASALGLAIIDHLQDENAGGVVDLLSEPRFAGQLGVVSWRHSDIPRLLAALGAPDGTYPRPWPEDEYGVLIEIVYRGEGARPDIKQHTGRFDGSMAP